MDELRRPKYKKEKQQKCKAKQKLLRLSQIWILNISFTNQFVSD